MIRLNKYKMIFAAKIRFTVLEFALCKLAVWENQTNYQHRVESSFEFDK